MPQQGRKLFRVDRVQNQEAPVSTFTVPLQAGDVLQANMKLGAPMLHDPVFSAHVHTEGGAVLATPAQMGQLHEEQPSTARSSGRRSRRLYRRSKFKPTPSTIEFTVAAFDDDGKVLNGIVNDGVPGESTEPSENKAGLNKAGSNNAGLFRVRQTLDVPLNAKSIRVGVRDRVNDGMGTLEVRFL